MFLRRSHLALAHFRMRIACTAIGGFAALPLVAGCPKPTSRVPNVLLFEPDAPSTGLASPSASTSHGPKVPPTSTALRPSGASTEPLKPVLPIRGDDAVLGKPDARVTVVVFSDFECPYCRLFDRGLRRLYASKAPGELRIVWKNLPLPMHKLAPAAALLGRAVLEAKGSEAFFRFADKTFASQFDLSTARLLSLAREESGLSEPALRSGLASGKWTERVREDLELAEKVRANSTPMSFWNGARVSGHLKDAELTELFAVVVKHAQKLEAQGVSRADLYATAFRALYTDSEDE